MNDGLSNDEIEDRFWVRGRMEILSVLNYLIHRREPITVNFDDETDCLLTRLLEVRNQALIFELSSDIDANLRLLNSSACTFVAHPDGIRVQFSGGQVRRISWGGCGAFSAPFPERLARLQRQESFRVLIPAQNPLPASLLSGSGAGLGEWPLHDLSVGGVGVTVSGWSPGEFEQTIARVRFLLPDHGKIDCAVILRHATNLAKDEINPPYRFGLEFTGLPTDMEAAIQRYIIKIAHDSRSIGHGI